MELKLHQYYFVGFPGSLLIVPYGIETRPNMYGSIGSVLF